jgi:hypothetical protein
MLIKAWNFGYPRVLWGAESYGDNNFSEFRHRFYSALRL